MNIQPSPERFRVATPVAPTQWGDATGAEQAVLAACLVQPSIVRDIAGIVHPDAFVVPFHRQAFEVMLALTEEGRSPSIEAVCGVLGSDVEIEHGLTVRAYLRELTRDVITAVFAPWKDAAETLADQYRRRRLATIGQSLSEFARHAPSLKDLGQEAVSGIDDIMGELRLREASHYGAGEAGEAIFAMLDGQGPEWPTTGLADLDRALGGGWPTSQLSIIAGRPGMGKSAVASSSALRSARRGIEHLIFSIEMTKEQVGARFLTDLAFTGDNPIMYADVLARRIDGNHRPRLERAQDELKRLPIHIDEQRGLTVSEIIARARKHANRLDKNGCKLGVIWIDHMGLVVPSNRYAGNKVNEIGEITAALATLAKDLDAAVVALCQLNRQVEQRDSKRPGMADLRDSGSIEQDASVVLFPYRAAYYLERAKYDEREKEMARLDLIEKHKNVLEIGLGKNRNGSIGTLKLFCDIGANAIRDGAYQT